MSQLHVNIRAQKHNSNKRFVGALVACVLITCAMVSQVSAEGQQESAIGIIIDILKSDDEAMHPVAIGMVKELPGEQVTRALAEELPNLPVTSQVQLLSALAERGDRAALPAVVEAMKADDESVRIAAIKALGQLGDASSVVLLAQTAASTRGEEQKIARESLYRLRGPEVDKTILSKIPQAQTGDKIELIYSIGQRNINAGVETLLETAKDSDRKIRLESFKVLKVVAGPEYLPALIELLMDLQSESDRDEAEKTIAAVAHKISDKNRQAEAVLAVLPAVNEVQQRCSLLRVLGKIGDDSSIAVLRTALKDGDVKVQDAAIRALSEWPSPAPIADLQEVVQGTDNKVHRILALRGFIRLIGLDSDRPVEETISLYKQAMNLAPDVSLKKRVLSGLANVESLDALQMAVEYLNDTDLRQEAELAVVSIAEAVQNSHPQQTETILQEIIENTKSDSVREAAQELLTKVEGLKKTDFVQEAREAIESADVYMGDWQGSWTMAEETGTGSGSMAAQVVALGKGEYRLNLLNQFDTGSPPIAVIEGQREDKKVQFAGSVEREGAESDIQAIIRDGKLTGTMKGQNSEGKYVSVEFALEKAYRVSPALGAEPPAGAIVLFDGTNLDQWEHVRTSVGLIGIAEVLGSHDNSAAYLKSNIWSVKQRKAVLHLGSDDGIKVWLNGQLVHANNIMRGCEPGQDKVDITLETGWNELMMKITNGGGGWEACVRLVGRYKLKIENIKERTTDGIDTAEYFEKNKGFLTFWEIAGPYQQEGKDGAAIFDVAFEPEKTLVSAETQTGAGDAQAVQWKQIDLNKYKPKEVRWRLIDGAMQVVPGSGSIITKRKFNDFKLHLEFRTPFMPEARGQSRGNSGVYLQGRYEVQILDSYGLKGLDNECGGVYQIGTPRVNMCAPPMQWQSYDITFRAPRFDEASKKVDNARISVIHNGVTIHENLVVPRPTAVAPDNNEREPGGIYLQDHGNEVQYRNIWLVELPTEQN